MDILFASERLQKACTVDRLMNRTWGEARAKLLRRRLDQLRAAPNLQALRTLPGRCHELTRDLAGRLSIDLDGPYRLIFEVANDPRPSKDDGGLDWTRVTAINVLEVADTHA